MKFLRNICTVIAIVLIVSANAQEAKKAGKIYIIDGYFFREIPMDQNLLTGLLPLKTANGTQAFGLSISQPLSDEMKSFAIPKEQIEEADILLEMYNEKKNRMIHFSSVKENILKPGQLFPQFTVQDLNGKKWNNDDVAGKVMVLNCWFTGCNPCLAEMPELSNWKDEMPDVMFFSATYEKAETARPVLEKTGFNWIPLVNDTQFKKYIGRNGYPMTIVIGKDGKIAQIEYGTSPLQRQNLKQTIQSLR